MSTLKVAILWHMHQPTYWDPRISKFRYPWVFLHNARHYHMMGRIARDHPETAMAFNFTPVLIEQMEHYIENGPKDDRLLEALLHPAADLDELQRELVLDHAFKLHLPTMVHPFPRYKQLHALIGDEPLTRQRARITPQDLLDLQTLYLITWCGIPLANSDPVKSLIEKGKDFTEEDKASVFQAMLEAMRETLPLFKELQDRGQIEMTTTPYYHPILPLLIDTASARESRHDVDIGEIDFRFPDDARWHVNAAIEMHRKHFGSAPRGMWPAEGSVSDGALQLMAEQGIEWAGTDEGVLGKSIGKFLVPAEQKYRPHRFQNSDLWVYFRDREMSDRVGFVYSGWEPKKGAEDVIARLLQARDHLGDRASEHCYTIILDGENPWEYYPDSGLGFLNHLYHLLANTEGLKSVRFCDHRREAATPSSLAHVVPGSWIDANFDTWIGCPEKNHAWKVLTASRKELALQAPDAQPSRDIYGAEGSDWFWWLGPGHDTPYESSYENLFRLQLKTGLEAAGVKPPSILEATAPLMPSPVYQPPLHLSSPPVDGKQGGYYDWLAAGFFKATEGSYHRTQRNFEVLRFAVDRWSLYLRLEGELGNLGAADDGQEGTTELQIEIQAEETFTFRFRSGELSGPDGARACLDEVLELQIDFEPLGLKPGTPFKIAAVLVEGDHTLDRLPQSGHVTLLCPDDDFGAEHWNV